MLKGTERTGWEFISVVSEKRKPEFYLWILFRGTFWGRGQWAEGWGTRSWQRVYFGVQEKLKTGWLSKVVQKKCYELSSNHLQLQDVTNDRARRERSNVRRANTIHCQRPQRQQRGVQTCRSSFMLIWGTQRGGNKRVKVMPCRERERKRERRDDADLTGEAEIPASSSQQQILLIEAHRRLTSYSSKHVWAKKTHTLTYTHTHTHTSNGSVKSSEGEQQS